MDNSLQSLDTARDKHAEFQKNKRHVQIQIIEMVYYSGFNYNNRNEYKRTDIESSKLLKKDLKMITNLCTQYFRLSVSFNFTAASTITTFLEILLNT